METGTIVVVLVDLSSEARRAAHFASDLARRAGATLTMVAAAGRAPVGGAGRIPDRARERMRDEARDLAVDEARHDLSDLHEELPHDVPIDTKIVEAGTSLAERVLEVVEDERCLTVVIPQRGGIRDRLIGDDSRGIVGESPVPVTLVP